jgi:hypothetical protein
MTKAIVFENHALVNFLTVPWEDFAVLVYRSSLYILLVLNILFCLRLLGPREEFIIQLSLEVLKSSNNFKLMAPIRPKARVQCKQ